MTQNTEHSDKKAPPSFTPYPSFMADKYVEAEIAATYPREICLMVSDPCTGTRRVLMAVTGDLKFEGELVDMAAAGEWAAKSLIGSLSGSCADPLLVFEASPKEGVLTPARINFFSDGRIEGVRPEDEKKAAAFWGSMLNTLKALQKQDERDEDRT